jgi:hypothetical protein
MKVDEMGRVCSTYDMKNTYTPTILVGEPEGRKPPGRFGRE